MICPKCGGNFSLNQNCERCNTPYSEIIEDIRHDEMKRLFLKMDFFKVCGLLSGSTTDPALLTFSEQMYSSSRIAVNYATVYPLTMFLRVVAAQVLIMSII